MLGRTMVLYNANPQTVSSACSSQIYGTWTTTLALIFTKYKAADDVVWNELGGLFDCVFTIQHLYFTGIPEGKRERFEMAEGLSSLLIRLRDLKTIAITRLQDSVGHRDPVTIAAEAHPLLFAALAKHSTLKRVHLLRFRPIPIPFSPTSGKDQTAPLTFGDPLGRACLQHLQKMPAFIPMSVSFVVRPETRHNAVEYGIESMVLIQEDSDHKLLQATMDANPDIQSTALFANLTALELIINNPMVSWSWWLSFISSKPLQSLRIHCIWEETQRRFDWAELFRQLPDTLQELILRVRLGFQNEGWAEGVCFDRNEIDTCIASSTPRNLRALNLTVVDTLTPGPNFPGCNRRDTVLNYPKSVSWCAANDIEFNVSEYDDMDNRLPVIRICTVY